MNLKEQTYICTLARCGTITKAAEELFITAPALSMFLSNLEKNLGVRLFSRTGKTLEPTPIGWEYIQHASQMLLLKEDFDRKLRKEDDMQKRTVRIAVQERRAISAVPWLHSRLTKALPDVNVLFQDGNYKELMKIWEQRQSDYLFYTLEDAIPGTDHVVLQQEPVRAAAPEGHPFEQLARHDPELAYPWIEPALLGGQEMILPPRTQSLRLTIDRLLEEAGLRPARITEIRSFDTIIEMVAEGMGIGFNRLGYIKGMRRQKGVCYYFLGHPPACSPLVLLYSKERKNAFYHDAVVEVFQAYVKQC